jgi:opacity protein-like surface antigen
MKKGISVLILAALVATGAFAQIALSAGGGGFFDLGLPLAEGADDNTLTFGAFGFFDATYAEADVAFGYGKQDKITTLGLEFSLLGKYPVALGSVTVFPLLGIKYNRVLSASNDGNSIDDAGELSYLGFQFGAGVDYPLSGALFLRGELLWNLNLYPSDTDADDTFQSHGPRLKVGVGYSF